MGTKGACASCHKGRSACSCLRIAKGVLLRELCLFVWGKGKGHFSALFLKELTLRASDEGAWIPEGSLKGAGVLHPTESPCIGDPSKSITVMQNWICWTMMQVWR